jgi:Flp pilus assembly protein TadG
MGAFKRFLRSRKGNVAIMFGLSLVPLAFLTGMGVDYTNAALREEQLNAIADAASLAAVTPAMMTQTDSASITAAQNAFNAQASTLPGVTYSAKNMSVTIVDTVTTRTATVTWTATSTNYFPNMMGQTMAISGTSQAVGSVAPNINFYLLLDDSPSMAIAATQSGINTMVANTSSQGGCAFACHESNPSADNLGNPGGEDNFALAQSLGVTLRIDNLRTAAENLTTTAQTTETNDHATYKMAIYTFDVGLNSIAPMTASMTTVANDAANIQQLEVYDNNNLTSSDGNSDEDTNWDAAMSGINTAMPNPGTGTNAAGDTPQEVLFIVTDGVEDEAVSGFSGSGSYGTFCCGNRQESTFGATSGTSSATSPAWCTTVKNRGIRIAVLYTVYYPLPTNSWYNSQVSSFQANIGQQLQNCASPGLYYAVSTGGDISAALSALFQQAVSTAHLTK